MLLKRETFVSIIDFMIFSIKLVIGRRQIESRFINDACDQESILLKHISESETCARIQQVVIFYFIHFVLLKSVKNLVGVYI